VQPKRRSNDVLKVATLGSSPKRIASSSPHGLAKRSASVAPSRMPAETMASFAAPRRMPKGMKSKMTRPSRTSSRSDVSIIGTVFAPLPNGG
jgi:hypothetical protein